MVEAGTTPMTLTYELDTIGYDDFDGTLPLIREGWPEVMLPMFEKLLPSVNGDDSASVRAMLLDDIMTLNGKQTIFQMMRFAERVTERDLQWVQDAFEIDVHR